MFKLKLKNVIKLATLSTVSFAALATIVSCGQNKNEWANKKDIVISVDGAQKEMYDSVEKAFKDTQSYKDGFRLKFIKKDVFAAIDTITTLGFTDENVSDLIYAPQDRITGLLQSKNVIKWSDEFMNSMLTKTGATEEEKNKLKTFGSIPVSPTESNFFAMQHNREGIVMMSSKTLEEARKTLTNPSTDSLAELVAQGKGFFRIQDFWYGNGILGGGLDETQIKKILYKKDATQGSWSSGFMKNDPNHAAYANVVKSAASLWYELWKAGYTNNQSAFTNKIEPGDIRALMSSDMNVVQNKVLELLESKKLEYALVGSWDIFNSIRRKIETFVNVPNVTDTSKYLQASGSWSFLFNARNNGVDSKRTAALEQVLDIIYNPESYWQYFKQDSKVPYTAELQSGVITKSKEAALASANEIKAFVETNGFSSVEELKTIYSSKLQPINDALEKAIPQTSDFWQSSESGDPLAETAIQAAPAKPSADLLIGATDKIKADLEAVEFKQTIGLRNAIAALLGLDGIEKLMGDGASWQVGSDLIKDGVEWDKEVIQDEKKKTAHMRKLEKLVFGQNGDQADERKAVVAKVMKDGATTSLSEIIKKATDFSAKYAKTEVAKDKIEKAATYYFNAILNKAAWDTIVEQYQPILNAQKFNKKDGTPSAKTNKEVKHLIDELEKGSVFDVVINVLTSSKPISEGLGVFQTQLARLDNGNPQFQPVWGIWNDELFGNVVFMQSLATENPNMTQEQFTQKLIDKLDSLYTSRTSILNSTTSSDKITF